MYETAWYQIDNIDEIDSPALAIHIERVKYNIDLAISMTCDASRLRPHVKTHKNKRGNVANDAGRHIEV